MIHLHLSNASDHNTTTTSFINPGTAVPKASCCLPIFCLASFFNIDLPPPFCTQIRQAISFRIVFTKNALHMIVDVGGWKCDLFLPPRVQRFPNMTYFPLKLLSRSRMTIYPFFGNIAVSTQVNRWSFFANMDGGVRGLNFSGFFTDCFQLLFVSNSCPV